MIIIKITGGLGNQLFQYAIGRSLSTRLNCELVLDTSFYSHQKLRKYELDKFNIKARIASKAEINNAGAGHHLLARLIRKLGLTSLIYPNYIKELGSVKYVEEIDKCKIGTYLDGYWQNPNYFDHNRKQLCDDFTPIEPISEQAEVWLSKIKATNSVSLHVRRGDYVQNLEANSTHGICPIEYYKAAVNTIEKNIKEPTFYIFSDDIKWCKEHFGFVKGKYFIDDTQTALDDLILMQNCQSNIIANSTFSWWGAWLNPKGIKVAPKKWYAEKEIISEQLFPSDWFLIK